MSDHVILHVEVATLPAAVGGWGKTEKLGVGLAALQECRSGRVVVFGPADLLQLRQRLAMADWVSGHDLLRFAYPLLWGLDWDGFRMGNFYRPLAPRTNDLMQRLLLAQGLRPDLVADGRERWPLGALAAGTLGRERIGDGTQAPARLAAGDWAAACCYALDALALTAGLVDFAERFGYLVHGGPGVNAGAVIRLAYAGLRPPPEGPGPPGDQGLLVPTGNVMQQDLNKPT